MGSHFLMALGIIGTMTGPLLTVLHLMPRAIFSGVFFIVGWGSIESNGIVKKILFLLREKRFQQPDDPLLKVRKRAIYHFIGWQLLGWACTVVNTITLVSFSSVRKSFSILSPTSPSGILTSSLVVPSSDMRDKKPSSVISSNWYSRRTTLGTSMLWVDGERSSNFLPVKMSRATKWTFA